MMRTYFYSIAFIIQSICGYSNVPCATDSLIPSDKGTKYGLLPNGFAYYLRPVKDSSASFAEIKLIVKAGFLNEGPDQTQAAHVIEHISTASTESYPDLRGYLARSGIQMGKEALAFTGLLSTNYSLSVPRDSRGDLAAYIRLVFDQFARPKLDSMTIERERRTVLNEYRSPDPKTGFTYEDLLCASEIDFDPLTTVQRLKQMKRDSLVAFYKSFYVPNRAAIVIVGDIDVPYIENLIVELFGQIPSQNKQVLLERKPSSQCVGSRVLIDSAAKQRFYSLEKVSLFKWFPSTSVGDVHCRLTRDLFNIMMFERLKIGFNENYTNGTFGGIRFEEKYLVPDYGFDALVTRLHLPAGITKDDRLAATKQLFLVMEQVIRYGFTEIEIESARQKKWNEVNRGSQKPNRYYVDVLTRHFLNGEAFPDIAYRDSLYRSMIYSITNEDIKNQFFKALASNSIYSAIRYPVGLAGNVPLESDVIAIISELKRQDVLEYSNIVSSVMPVMSRRRVQSIKELKIVSKRTFSPEVGVTIVELQNGVTIVFKRTGPQTSGEQRIFLTGIRKLKRTLNNEHLLLGSIAVRSANAGGVKGYGRDKIDVLFKRRGMFLMPYVLSDRVGFQGECKFEGVESMMQLIKLFIEDPQFGNLEYSSRDLTNWGTTPSVYDSINQMFVGNSVKNGFSDMSVDKNSAIRVYKELFGSVSGFSFVLTGDVDPDVLFSKIVPYLASIRENAIRQTRKSMSVDLVTSENIRENRDAAFEVFDKCNTSGCTVNLMLFNESDGGPVSRAECMLLKEILTDRLYYRLRTQTGNIYSLAISEDQIGSRQHRFVISLSTSNGEIDEIIADLWDEIDRLCSVGVDQPMIVAAADRAINELVRNDPEFWQSYIQSQILNGRSCTEISDWSRILSYMKANTITDIAKRWLRFRRVVPISIGRT